MRSWITSARWSMVASAPCSRATAAAEGERWGFFNRLVPFHVRKAQDRRRAGDAPERRYFLGPAGDGDDVGAQLLADLHRGEADAACRTGHDQPFAGLKPAALGEGEVRGASRR